MYIVDCCGIEAERVYEIKIIWKDAFVYKNISSCKQDFDVDMWVVLF
jgi:hypothetical protein